MWLLEQSVLHRLEEARTHALLSDERRAQFEAQVLAARRSDTPRGFSVEGDTAVIQVEGLLTPKPDFLATLLGMSNTSYADLQAAVAHARSSPAIRAVRLWIDSPGGTVEGLFETLAAMEQLRAEKPVSVRAARAQSAAYAIAAMAGPIEAHHAASAFGSVGVAVSHRLHSDVIDLTNSQSPDKRPDLSTPEGRAVVVRELDAIYDLTVEAIANGRGTSRLDVVEHFGRGATLLASEAKRRGMIDRIGPSLRSRVALAHADSVLHDGDPTSSTQPAPSGERHPAMTPKEPKQMEPMNRTTLRAEHPDLYEAVLQEGVAQGLERGREQGVAEERDRVAAHLTMGEQAGDFQTAFEAIRSGATMTQSMTARYLAAGMNRAAGVARQRDSDELGEALQGATSRESAASLLDRAADAVGA